MNTQRRVIVLAVHGMGDTRPSYAARLQNELRDRLNEDSAKIYFSSVYYQDIFQDNQGALWNRYKHRALDWRKVRKLLLYGFSDAAGYERKAEQPGSGYERVQLAIHAKLTELYDKTGGLPIVLVAQSLGGHVISDYIWDAQRVGGATRGIWRPNGPGGAQDVELDRFLRLKSLNLLYTSGCNIPVFLASLSEPEIQAIETKARGYKFNWKNFYDEDDALGRPPSLRCCTIAAALACPTSRQTFFGLPSLSSFLSPWAMGIGLSCPAQPPSRFG